MKKIIILGICASIVVISGCTLPTKNTTSGTTTPTVSTKPYEIGSVDTAFQRVGPDHHIEIGAVPDPKIQGISCFYSRARTWGIKWGLGLAEDTSDASVACRQIWPIVFKEAIKQQEEIRNESTSLLFKKIRIVRFYDNKSNSLIYLVYSDKLIDGSPKNSLSAVALDTIQVILK